jgi:acyl dehydratase
MPEPISTSRLATLVGHQVGVSDWLVISQEMIDRFADATLDHQFIHVDADRAKDTQFGGTLAHGFLSLSLLPRLCFDTLAPIEGVDMEINYGINRLRFVTPVRSGARIRALFTLSGLEQKAPKQWLRTYGVAVEIEGEVKPALVAEWLMLAVLK